MQNKVRFNGSTLNGIISGDFFNNYTNLFLNTATGQFALVNSTGNVPENYYVYCETLSTESSTVYHNVHNQCYNRSHSWWVTYPSADTFVECVRIIYDRVSATSYSLSPFDAYRIYLDDFVKHVYVGDSWANRNEIFNLINLNFDDTGTNYYVTPADDNNYLLDIKGILNDILNNLNLLAFI